MKTTFLFVPLFFVSVCAIAQQKQEVSVVNNGAKITWSSTTTYEFGDVKKGTPVTATFEFTNDGSAPLIVSDAKGSCGCTSVEYPQQPLSPGAKGCIKATYNANALGAFNKVVTVTTNSANSTIQLYIKGKVIE